MNSFKTCTKARYRLSFRDPNVSLTNLRYSNPWSIVGFSSVPAPDPLLHNICIKIILRFLHYDKEGEKETRETRWSYWEDDDGWLGSAMEALRSFNSNSQSRYFRVCWLLQLVALYRVRDDYGPKFMDLGRSRALWVYSMVTLQCNKLPEITKTKRMIGNCFFFLYYIYFRFFLIGISWFNQV